MTSYDVYAYGVVSASTLYTISDAYPAEEGYAEIRHEYSMTGGEATNSSIALARLGASVKLDGTWLGDDPAGARTKALLDGFDIDTSNLPLKQGHETTREAIVAAGGTRTIFGTYGRMHETVSWNAPDEQSILNAKVLCLDPFFGEQSLTAARIAGGAGVPVVTVDCSYDDPLLEHSSAIVVAESFLRETYPESAAEDVFRRYQSATAGLVVFTFGGDECWFGRKGRDVESYPAFSVHATDTAGAGDSFRAGVVYGVLNGWEDRRTIGFSSALAAIVCTRSPGVLESPSLNEVVDFMQQSGQ